SLNMTKSDASTILSASLSAEFAHQFHRFIDGFRGDVERRTEPDRVFARAKRQNTEVEKPMPKLFARFRIVKIERKKYSAATRRRNQRLFGLQFAQLIQEIRTNFSGVLNQPFLLDDAQIMRRAHHISEVSAPRRIQTARQAKRVVFHFINPRAGHHTADLRF